MQNGTVLLPGYATGVLRHGHCRQAVMIVGSRGPFGDARRIGRKDHLRLQKRSYASFYIEKMLMPSGAKHFAPRHRSMSRSIN